MSEKTGIQWAGMMDEEGHFLQGGTLNIAGGCTKTAQEACRFCYAMAVTEGLAKKLGPGNRYEGLTKLSSKGAQWTNKVIPFPDRLEPVLRKQKSKAWFVSSLTDVFHEALPDDFLCEVFGMFAVARQHKFYCLTKRPERQAEFLLSNKERIMAEAKRWIERVPNLKLTLPETWPLTNVWTGASAGNYEALVEILPSLLRTPSICQWMSLEPLIGDPMVKEALAPYTADERANLKWAIFGGESGPYSRPMDLAWVRKGIADCRELGISPFFKQKGEVLARTLDCKDKKGGNPAEWPEDVRVREFPTLVGA